MKKKERVLGKLSEEQLEVFRGLEHCLNAASFIIDVVSENIDKKHTSFDTGRSLIEATLHELEGRKIMEMAMYDRLKREYFLTDEELSKIEIDPDNGEVYILDNEYFEMSHNGKLDIKKFNLMWGR